MFEKRSGRSKKKIEATRREIFANLTTWQKVQLARHPKRPYSLDYIEAIFDDFQELHGDRRMGDDQALIGGTAFFEGKAVILLAQQKGRGTKENLQRNFGMPQPQGYRKANRLMKTAGKFNLPLISFIDTPGAYPGIKAEECHVAEAIATNLMEMSQLPVPIIAFVWLIHSVSVWKPRMAWAFVLVVLSLHIPWYLTRPAFDDWEWHTPPVRNQQLTTRNKTQNS